MPTVLRINRYRFFFFSNEGSEPVHIHVESDDNHAKFWLTPLRLAKSTGFTARQIKELRELVFQHQIMFKEKWYEYFTVQE